MKKKAETSTDLESVTTRDFKVSFTLNEKEYNAVCRYLDKYKISNRNRWFRETILCHILQKMEENHPTLFSENEMRR
ncbi:MAG: hypothetical protein Q4F97_04110 [Bacteroidales bacterium]|nr:hypothetical protein [Bacteroidales bacterium]